MSEKIPPALSETQWGSIQRSTFQRTSVEHELMTALLRDEPVPGIPEPRKALAALLLVGAPFGFTWRDVHCLRLAAEHFEASGTGLRYNARGIRDVAERIAAQLPPEETHG